jgi:hypothetical protein
VVSRDVGDLTVTEHLECGHGNTLYRQARGGRVAWCNRAGAPTNLDARSRECETCERAAGDQPGWTT